MLFWKRFPFIRITGAFCSGIWTGSNLEIPLRSLIYLTVFSILVFILLNMFLKRKNFRNFNMLISLFAFSAIFLCGLLLIRHKHVKSEMTLRYVSEKTSGYYLVRALQLTGSTEKYNKLLAELILIGSGQEVQRIHGKILLYLPSDASVGYGYLVLVKGKPVPFDKPVFPLEFDYREHMFRRGILFHQFLKSPGYRIMDKKGAGNLPAYAFRLRENLIGRIQERIADDRVEALMIALTTGKRDYFDKETYDEFLEAGIVHILAVSGLHVGIVYYLLLLITRPLSLSRPLRLIRLFIILTVFLFTALFTGLTPSVLRSVVMFAIITLGITFNRRTSILNSVFLSAFFLLSFDPGFLWQAGFQLSYSAVLGIILFQPLIKAILNPAYLPLQWAWNLTTVSLSAQLATLPFSLFYFKQFPTFFLIANFFAIPFASLFIPGCILFGLTQTISQLNCWISKILEILAILFFQVIQVINMLPGNLIFPINISLADAFLIFCLIIFLYIILKYRKYKAILIMFFILFFIVSKDSYRYFSGSSRKTILVYTINNVPVLELIDGHQAYIIFQKSGNNEKERLKFHVDNYHIRQNIRYEILSMEEVNKYIPCLKTEETMWIFWYGKIIAIVKTRLSEVPVWDVMKPDVVIGMNNRYARLLYPSPEDRRENEDCKVNTNGVITEITFID